MVPDLNTTAKNCAQNKCTLINTHSKIQHTLLANETVIFPSTPFNLFGYCYSDSSFTKRRLSFCALIKSTAYIPGYMCRMSGLNPHLDRSKAINRARFLRKHLNFCLIKHFASSCSFIAAPKKVFSKTAEIT